MTQTSKFLFEQEFFTDRTVSKETLSIEKRQSFAEGFEAGRRKALEEIEHQVLESFDRVQQVLHQITAQKETSLRYAVSIAEKIFLTIFPKHSKEGALQEVTSIAEQVLEKLNAENHILIKCHPSLKESLEARLKELSSSVPFHIQEDEGFSGSDVHIDWKTGFLFRSEGDLALQIQSILETYKEKNHE